MYKLNYDYVRERCYKRKLITGITEEIFDKKTSAQIKNLSSSHAIPASNLVPGLLPVVSHNMKDSRIIPWGTWSQPSIIFCCVLGFTGSNKSGAVKILRDSVRQVEKASGRSVEDSRFNQCEYKNVLSCFHNLFNLLHLI
jgi:serine/threonine-protein kinase RIO1